MIRIIGRRCFYSCLVNSSSAKSSDLGKLRKATGYSVSNCKKALEKFSGDILKAEEWLHAEAKQQGWSQWAKVQSRTATQGLIGVFSKDKIGVMVEVNCETDFVAKNAGFHQLVEKILSSCVNHIPSTSGTENVSKVMLNESQLLDLQSDSGSVGELVNAAVSVFNEKTVAKRAVCVRVAGDLCLSSLSHPSTNCPNLYGATLGKYGTLLAYKKNSPTEDEILDQKVCQHIIGMNPLSTGELTEQDILNFNKRENGEILADSELENRSSVVEGQPCENPETAEEQEESDSVVDNVKENDETRLLFQPFLLDADITVGEMVYTNGLEIADFTRFECGENQPESNEIKEAESVAL